MKLKVQVRFRVFLVQRLYADRFYIKIQNHLRGTAGNSPLNGMNKRPVESAVLIVISVNYP